MSGYASDYGPRLLSAHEKVQELYRQRDTALLQVAEVKIKLADSKAEVAALRELLDTTEGTRFAESQRQLGAALRHNYELRAALDAAMEDKI